MGGCATRKCLWSRTGPGKLGPSWPWQPLGTLALAQWPWLPRPACLVVPASLPACLPCWPRAATACATLRRLPSPLLCDGAIPRRSDGFQWQRPFICLELTSPLIKTKLHCTASPDNPGCICDAINYVLETVSRFEVLFMNLHISGHHSNMQLKIWIHT